MIISDKYRRERIKGLQPACWVQQQTWVTMLLLHRHLNDWKAPKGMKEQGISPAETLPSPGVYKSYLEYRGIWFWNSSALEGGYADDYRLRPRQASGNIIIVIIILILEVSRLVAYELCWLHRVQARKYKRKRSKLKPGRQREGSFALEAIIQVARSLGTKSLVDTN